MIVDALTVLLKHSMGVQSCEIIMKDMFGKLDGVAATALAAVPSKIARLKFHRLKCMFPCWAAMMFWR